MDRDEARAKAMLLIRDEMSRIYEGGVSHGLMVAATGEALNHKSGCRGRQRVLDEAFDLMASDVVSADKIVPGSRREDLGRIDVDAVCAKWERLGGECARDHLGGGMVLRTSRGQVVACVKTSHADFFADPWVTGPTKTTRVTEGFMEVLPKLAKAWGLAPRVGAGQAKVEMRGSYAIVDPGTPAQLALLGAGWTQTDVVDGWAHMEPGTDTTGVRS